MADDSKETNLSHVFKKAFSKTHRDTCHSLRFAVNQYSAPPPRYLPAQLGRVSTGFSKYKRKFFSTRIKTMSTLFKTSLAWRSLFLARNGHYGTRRGLPAPRLDTLHPGSCRQSSSFSIKHLRLVTGVYECGRPVITRFSCDARIGGSARLGTSAYREEKSSVKGETEKQKQLNAAAKRWTSLMVGLPVLLVTSYYLFDRREHSTSRTISTGLYI